MWYAIDHPATWAGLNSFLSGVLRLWSDTFDAMLTQPVMALFMGSALMAVVFALVRGLLKLAKEDSLK